ncbi:hypothetical protein HJC23_008901 [Cyclotella cryptica]|uniref:Uncharacterized protein n=1 Tax=Cyclotella cryptica TaxID=29204 RepID=A0ABD3NUX9_9STRA|eukprot:CCRYP_019572-RA/>CCRYP_019572-RA protein AED:0.24 eAED:0.24 QI:0/-1/0/1/-1/1/1/0/244
MHKYYSTKGFLRNKSLQLETKRCVYTLNNSDQTILTTQGRLADTHKEESIDISRLDRHDIERIRKEDPFMYYSIIQHITTIPSSSFVLDHDGVDDELGWEGRCPADTAAGNPYPCTIFEDNVYVDHSNSTSSHASNSHASIAASQHCVSHACTQLFRLSSSLQQVPASYSSRHQGTLSESSPSYSTCVVTRKSRISVETDFCREMADLMASLSGHTHSDLASMFQWNSDSDSDLQQVDSCSVGL